MARFISQSKTFTVNELHGLRFPWLTRMAVELWRPLRQFIYARDGGRCCDCGLPVELTDCHIHHVLELQEGGTNHPTNLKTLCVDCHKQRHPFMQDAHDKLSSASGAELTGSPTL